MEERDRGEGRREDGEKQRKKDEKRGGRTYILCMFSLVLTSATGAVLVVEMNRKSFNKSKMNKETYIEIYIYIHTYETKQTSNEMKDTDSVG